MSYEALKDQLKLRSPLYKNEPHYVTEYIDEKKDLILEFIKNHRIGAIRAPLGSGKTYSTIKILLDEGIPFIFAAPLRVIAEQNLIKFISEKKYKKSIALVMSKDLSGQFNYGISLLSSKTKIKNSYHKNENISFLLVYDSINKLIDADLPLDKYTLVIDEAHMLITEYDYRGKAVECLIKSFSRFKSAIYLSGSFETLYFFERFNTLSFEFEEKKSAPQEIELIPKAELGDHPLMALVNLLLLFKDKKVVVYINDIRSMLRIRNALLRKGLPKKSIKILHSKTKNSKSYLDLVNLEHIDENVKVVLTSDLIATGTNIKNEDIDYCIIYDVKKMQNKRQFIGRFRKGVKEKNIIISDYKDEENSDFRFRESFINFINPNLETAISNTVNDKANITSYTKSLIEENYSIQKKINNEILKNPEHEKVYLEETTSSKVTIESFKTYENQFGDDRIKSKNEFDKLAESFWADDEYFWDNYPDLLLYYIKFCSDYFAKSLIFGKLLVKEDLIDFERPTEFMEIDYKYGIKERQRELNALSNLISHGVGYGRLFYLFKHTSLSDRLFVLEKIYEYLEYYSYKKLLNKDRRPFKFQAMRIHKFLESLPSKDGSLSLPLQKLVVIKKVTDYFRENRIIKIQDVNDEVYNYLEKFSPLDSSKLSVRDIILALYKPVNRNQRWQIKNSRNLTRTKLGLETTIADIVSFIVGIEKEPASNFLREVYQENRPDKYLIIPPNVAALYGAFSFDILRAISFHFSPNRSRRNSSIKNISDLRKSISNKNKSI